MAEFVMGDVHITCQPDIKTGTERGIGVKIQTFKVAGRVSLAEKCGFSVANFFHLHLPRKARGRSIGSAEIGRFDLAAAGVSDTDRRFGRELAIERIAGINF